MHCLEGLGPGLDAGAASGAARGDVGVAALERGADLGLASEVEAMARVAPLLLDGGGLPVDDPLERLVVRERQEGLEVRMGRGPQLVGHPGLVGVGVGLDQRVGVGRLADVAQASRTGAP